MRRVLAAGLGLGLVPAGAALLLVHPAAAAPVAPTGYDSVASSAMVSGVLAEGSVGASGGLANLGGTGSARVVATLDGSPSAHVLAAPYEPGVLVRTVVGQVNTGAGAQVLDVPDAEAASPGSPHHDAIETVPGRSVGPLAVVGGSATADAAPQRAAGTANGMSLAIVGALTVGGSKSSVELLADPARATASQAGTTAVASVDVAGVLHLTDVVGAARTTAAGDRHTAQQSLTIGGASVGGQAVTIGNDGVTAVGTALVPGSSVAEATNRANALLSQAGITVRTVGGVVRHDARSARADTGGVRITLSTPGLPVGGVSGNTLDVLVGQVALTEIDALPVPLPLVAPGPPKGSTVVPPTTSTTFVPGTPGTPALPGTAVAPPTVAGAPASYVLAGRRFSARTALIAFGAWQVLSLGMPTLYALVERRRRLAVAGAP